jgi:hypothetical protein
VAGGAVGGGGGSGGGNGGAVTGGMIGGRIGGGVPGLNSRGRLLWSIIAPSPDSIAAKSDNPDEDATNRRVTNSESESTVCRLDL